MIRLIKNMINRSIKRLINYFGYELRGIKPILSHNNYDAIHKFIVNKILELEDPIIFDVDRYHNLKTQDVIDFIKNQTKFKNRRTINKKRKICSRNRGNSL